LFSGNFSQLGGDLWGSPTKDIETIGGVLGGLGLGAGALGLLGGAGGAAAGAAGAGAAGAPLDILAGGAAEGTADAAGVGTFLAGGAGDAAGASLGLDAAGGATDALSLLDPAAGGLTSDAGISAINAAAPLGTTTGAATDASIGTLSVPGLPDSSVAATDLLTNDAGATASSPSFLSQLTTGAVNSVTKNPLGILAAGTGLGLSILRGNQTDPNQAQLQAEAPGLQAQGAALTASGQNLQTYLTNGTLPPGLQQQVNNAAQAAKARIIQNHASNGENTNPAQNSALAQELNQVDLDAIAQAGTLEQQLFSSGTQLLQTGLSETGLSEQIYESLVKMDQTNNNALMASIASMAAALGGGTKIQIGGTQAA
jgi:hypothetical protein